MNDSRFDEFVKRQFSNYAPDVPKHIVENIFAKRKLKPKGFWINWLNKGNILFASLLLVTGISIYYFISYQDKTEKPTNKNSIDQAAKNLPSLLNKNIQENTKDKPNTDEPVNNNSNAVINTKEPLIRNTSNSTIKTQQIDQPLHKNDYNVSEKKADDVNDVSNSENNLNYTNVKKVWFPFIFNNTRELTGTKTISFKNIKLPDCPGIEKNAAANKKYWEVYAGPDYAFNNYRTYGDTASNNYLLKTKASTKFASAFSAGVRYTKVFSNAMSVRTGLNYSQVNEKFIYFNPNEIKFVTVITTRVVIRSPGDTLYISDTLQYQQSGTRTKTTNNRYRSIDVPLVIGYELGNGKVHANINAGLIINVYSWYKGDALDTLYQPVSITTGKGNPQYQFKNNIGIGFLGSASFYYKFTENMHLLIEPYFRYNLSPMSNNNSNLQQKFHTAGIRAGIRWNLK